MSTVPMCPNGHPLAVADSTCPTCGTLTARTEVPLAQPADLPVIPGFVVVKELGRGGMGVVYLALEVDLQRRVALKMIRDPTLAGAHERARFLREAQALARLQHPNIVAVYAIGEHKGCPYIVMEFMEGDTLAKQLAGRPQPPRAAAALGATLGRAVHAAHQKAIVHRDLKPANILLTADGTLKIADFGLARLLDRPSGSSGAILGTVPYMAPEQARGTSAVGEPADVYALGVVLYEMLTGRPPFLGETYDVLKQVIECEPLPPARLQPQVERDLDLICLKCLDKDQVRRYPSAQALAEDLDAYLAGRPVRVRPTPVWRRAVKWARRRPATALLLLVSLVTALSVVGLGVGLHYNAKLQSALTQTKLQKERAEQLQYLADMNAVAHAVRPEDVLLSRSLLERYRDTAADVPDHRDFEWYYLWGLRHVAERSLQAHASAASAVAFSRDGTRIVSAGGDGRVRAWDARAGTAVWSADGDGQSVAALAISRDGKRIAAAYAGGTVRLLDAATGAAEPLLRRAAGAVYGVALSADGRYLAVGADGVIHLWDLQTGKARDLAGHDGPIYGLAFHPKRGELISGGADGTLRFWNVTTGREDAARRLKNQGRGEERPAGIRSLTCNDDGSQLAWANAQRGTARIWTLAAPRTNLITVRGHAGEVWSVAFGPGGRLATGGQDRTVRIWDADNGRSQGAFAGHSRPVHTVAFSPVVTIGQLASADDDGVVMIWRYRDNNAEPLTLNPAAVLAGLAFATDSQELVAAEADGSLATWTDASGGLPPARRGPWQPGVTLAALRPDGQALAGACRDGTIQAWHLGEARTLFTLPVAAAACRALAWARNGDRLAVARADGSVAVWDTGTPALVRTFTDAKGPVAALALSPDGQRLAWASADMTVRIRSVAGDGATLTLLHTTAILAVAFSLSGQRLASGGQDGSVHLWDTLSGQEILAFDSETLGARVTALALSPDGKRLAAAGANETQRATLRIWNGKVGAIKLER